MTTSVFNKNLNISGTTLFLLSLKGLSKKHNFFFFIATLKNNAGIKSSDTSWQITLQRRATSQLSPVYFPFPIFTQPTFTIFVWQNDTFLEKIWLPFNKF